jgi:hypothetical protein
VPPTPFALNGIAQIRYHHRTGGVAVAISGLLHGHAVTDERQDLMHNGKTGTLALRGLLAAVFAAFAMAAVSCAQPGAQNPAPAPVTSSQNSK